MSAAPRKRKVSPLYPVLIVGFFLLLFSGLGLAICSDVLWYSEQEERVEQLAAREYGALVREHGFTQTAPAEDEALLQGKLNEYSVTVHLKEGGRYRGVRLRREVTLHLKAPLGEEAGEVQIVGIELNKGDLVGSVDEKTVLKEGGQALARRLTPDLKAQIGRLLLRFPGTLSVTRDQLTWTSTWSDFNEPPDALVQALPELADALAKN